MSDRAAAEAAVLWPKLFRRLISYFAAFPNVRLAAFAAWLRADLITRDDPFLLPDADPPNPPHTRPAGPPARCDLGAEYVFRGAFIARAGYVVDGFAHQRRWSAGLGYVNAQFGLDFAYGHTAGYHHVSQLWSLGLRLFF